MQVISNNNQVNFTARLNVKNVQSNLHQWKQTAKFVENKSKDLDYDLYINEYPEGTNIYAMSLPGFEHELRLSDKTLNKLLAMSPKNLAEKLIKLTKLFAKEDAENIKVMEFLEHFGKSEAAPKDFFLDNYANFANINAKNTSLALEKDNIFKDSEYII